MKDKYTSSGTRSAIAKFNTHVTIDQNLIWKDTDGAEYTLTIKYEIKKRIPYYTA